MDGVAVSLAFGASALSVADPCALAMGYPLGAPTLALPLRGGV